jgi:hypothetical protein
VVELSQSDNQLRAQLTSLGILRKVSKTAVKGRAWQIKGFIVNITRLSNHEKLVSITAELSRHRHGTSLRFDIPF